MKTALQLTIDKINFIIKMWEDTNNEMDGLHIFETLKKDTINLLRLEKEQIVNAYHEGQSGVVKAVNKYIPLLKEMEEIDAVERGFGKNKEAEIYYESIFKQTR